MATSARWSQPQRGNPPRGGFAVPPSRPALAKDDRELEATVEWDRHRLERRVRLARLRIGAERLLVREHVVGDDQRPRLELRPRELEQALVVVLLGVEEDDVEDVVDCRQ